MKGNVLKTAARLICTISEFLLIFCCLFYAYKLFTSESEPEICGITPLVVLSDSMYPAIEAGDLIMIRRSDDGAYTQGDIIAFYDNDDGGAEPMIVTHRIVDVEHLPDGSAMYTTQGDANNSPDKDAVRQADVIGRLSCRIIRIGKIILRLRNHLPWIGGLLMLLIIMRCAAAAAHKAPARGDEGYEKT